MAAGCAITCRPPSASSGSEATRGGPQPRLGPLVGNEDEVDHGGAGLAFGQFQGLIRRRLRACQQHRPGAGEAFRSQTGHEGGLVAHAGEAAGFLRFLAHEAKPDPGRRGRDDVADVPAQKRFAANQYRYGSFSQLGAPERGEAEHAAAAA